MPYYSVLGWRKSEYPVRFIVSCQDNRCKFNLVEDDLRPQKKIWRDMIKNPKWLDKRVTYFKKAITELVQKLKSLDVQNSSDQELFQAYQEFIYFYFLFQNKGNCQSRLIDRYGLEVLRKELDQAQVKDIEKAITALTNLQKESYLAEEERLFWQGVVKAKSKKKIHSFLSQHLKKYAYIGKSYYNEPPLSKNDLKKRISQYPKKEWLKKSKESLTLIKKAKSEYKKVLKNKKIDNQIRKSALILRKSAYLKDFIRGSLAQSYFWGEKVFEELARRTGLKEWQIKCFTVEEFRKYFLKGINFDKTIFQKRTKGPYLTLTQGQKVRILYGKEARAFDKKYLKLAVTKNLKEIKGRPISQGKAQGKVRVIFNVAEAKTLKKGEILVVNNTNPAFVPYLKRVKAIIAEEGGVTTHVAIVSRELGIPCIIGITGAKELFKTGDKVEVDANKGLVRKI